ncbi:hypothetical protein [Streptomyces sp. NPDC046805]|uniref:hypothetical protein n=1 Tax=Streptomyces sp. NPDC046805 TaxID=3155134 RepID=UPI00340362B8
MLIAFQVWLIFGDSIPSRSEARGTLGRLYALADMAGRPIVLAVLSVTLYLLGDIWKLPAPQIASIHSRLRGNNSLLSPESRIQLHVFAEGAFRRRPLDDSRPSPSNRLVQDIQTEFPDIRMRLIVNHTDIYLEHDRLESEAEFRVNVAFHSVAMWVVLALTLTPWCMLGLVATVLLYENGIRTFRGANAILVQSIVSGIMTSRYYEEEVQRDEANEGSATA